MDDRALLQRMCDVQAHRGPDDEGKHHATVAGLGNRRLAIVDVAGGHQPIPNEDESVWITFNGEIYNHPELRDELVRLGHRFTTRSDTEVLVHAYEAWSDRFLSRLNGIFAFAIWDQNRERLLLARDPLGVKPLHYAFLDDALLFASETKALLQHEGVERRLNRKALFAFLNQWYVPGEDTLLSGIKRVLPGHAVAFEGGKATTFRFWQPDLSPVPGSEEGYIEAVRRALEESVRRELQGEVPIGVMLSGGMDSTTLVALMSRHWKDPIHTYTVNFGTSNDEGTDARLVAEHFGTRHHEMFVGKEILREIPRMVWHMDEPRFALGPTFELARAAKKHVKVLLSGVGGDELFFGYGRDLKAYRYGGVPDSVPRTLRSALGRVPTPTDKTERVVGFLRSGGDPPAIYESFAPTGPLTSRECEAMLGPGLAEGDRIRVRELYRPYFTGLSRYEFAHQALFVELQTYMAEDLLHIVDRMLAAHGVEGRVPICNREIVELAFRIPLELKAKAQKHILRHAMTRILPDAIVRDRRKRVFGHPAWHWFDGGIRDISRQLLTKRRVESFGFFRHGWIERLLSAPVDPKRERDYVHLWNLACFDVWHRQFVEGDPRRPELKLDRLV